MVAKVESLNRQKKAKVATSSQGELTLGQNIRLFIQQDEMDYLARAGIIDAAYEARLYALKNIPDKGSKVKEHKPDGKKDISGHVVFVFNREPLGGPRYATDFTSFRQKTTTVLTSRAVTVHAARDENGDLVGIRYNNSGQIFPAEPESVKSTLIAAVQRSNSKEEPVMKRSPVPTDRNPIHVSPRPTKTEDLTDEEKEKYARMARERTFG